jgi:hypothetical protein
MASSPLAYGVDQCSCWMLTGTGLARNSCRRYSACIVTRSVPQLPDDGIDLPLTQPNFVSVAKLEPRWLVGAAML